MSMFSPTEKAITIRQPSTANLMVDSADRDTDNYPDAGNFVINKRQSILNGFFTRIGITEHVLEWSYPNINSDLSNTVLIVNNGTADFSIVVPSGFYTAEELLDAVVAAGNALPITGVTLSVTAPSGTNPYASLDGTAPFSIVGGNMFFQLFPALAPPLGPLTSYNIVDPDLRPFRYLDFVSEKLTYNQDLKDDATNDQTRNVLTRWYMAYDNPPTVDGYGYPILMGYTQFVLRRTFSPPKQIRWSPEQPIGQLDFQVYIDPESNNIWNLPRGGLLIGEYWSAFWDFLMTLQVSEV
jgi:hypothetical protein